LSTRRRSFIAESRENGLIGLVKLLWLAIQHILAVAKSYSAYWY